MTTTTNDSSLEHEIGPAGQFHLRQLSGSVRVRGVDGGAARVRELNGRSLGDGFQIEAAEGLLSLTAPDRFGFDLILGVGRRWSPDLEIEVPRGAAITIETASADLEARDLVGRTKLRTASGDIDLDGIAGVLELDSVSGEARVGAVAALDLRARTISGDLVVRGPRLGRAEIGTTSGDVRLDADLGGKGPYAIETVSGDATIVGRMGLQVEARTVTGDLRSDLPHRRENGPGRKRLVVGDGGVTLAFKSVSGDLRVAEPRGPLPVAVAGIPVAPIPPEPPMEPGPVSPPAAPATPSPAPPNRDGLPSAGGREVARLDILRAVERGELSVDAAMRRIAEIEEA